MCHVFRFFFFIFLFVSLFFFLVRVVGVAPSLRHVVCACMHACVWVDGVRVAGYEICHMLYAIVRLYVLVRIYQFIDGIFLLFCLFVCLIICVCVCFICSGCVMYIVPSSMIITMMNMKDERVCVGCCV